MTLSLQLSNLKSRAARAKVAVGGVRRFAVGALQTEVSGDVVSKLWNGFARSVGFLIGSTASLLFQGLAFSITSIVGLLVSTFQFVWNFNWNTDFNDSRSQLKSGLESLAGTLGGTVGNALGFLVCGGGATALIMTFNEPLALYIFKELGEEALQEISANLANLITQAAKLTAASAFTFLYASGRTLLTQGSTALYSQLIGQGKVTQKQIDDTKRAKKEPWSFSKGLQNLIESIPNQAIENFIEEGVEEFSDACIESGYIIEASISSYLSAAKIANGGILGTDQAVEILLNRQTEPETP